MLIFEFQVGDYCGRTAPRFFRDVPLRLIYLLAALRLAFFPLFLFCVSPRLFTTGSRPVCVCVCVCVCLCVCMDFFVFVSMWVLTRTETVRFCGESRDPASTRAMRILANECHKIGPTTSARCGAVRHHGVLCLLQRLPGNPAHDVCAGAGRPARARDDRHWYVMPRCARLGCDRVHLRVSRWCCFVSFLALRRVPRLPIPPLPLP